MAVNKVVFNTADGEQTLIDLTKDNVTAEAVFEGATFHGPDGEVKTGTFTIAEEMSEQDSVIAQIQTALQGKAAGVNLDQELAEQDSLISYIESALVGKAAGGDTSIEDGLVSHTLSMAEYANDRVTSIGYGSFYGCSKLTKVLMPKVTSIDGYAFYKCTSLTHIDAPLIKSAGSYAFSYTKLPNIYFPLLETISTYTFSEITIPFTVYLPSLKTAGNSSFRNSKGLISADLPVCAKVDNLCFYYANGLKTLILRKSDAICTLQNTNAFTGTEIAKGTGYIYVPKNLLEQYAQATNWSTFATQFRAIEDYPEICGGTV